MLCKCKSIHFYFIHFLTVGISGSLKSGYLSLYLFDELQTINNNFKYCTADTLHGTQSNVLFDTTSIKFTMFLCYSL